MAYPRTHRLRLPLLRVLLSALLAIGAADAGAAPAPADEPPPTILAAPQEAEGATGDDGAAADAGAEAATTAVETPDVFIPSVEVSEDLSVAFPVDI